MRRKQNSSNQTMNKGLEIVNKARKVRKEKKEGTATAQDSKKKLIKIILIIVLIIIMWYVVKNRHILGITLSKHITDNDTTLIETTSSENTMLEYRNEILVYSKGTMMTYSRFGEKTWEHTLEETFIPEINVSGKYIQLINKDTGYMYIFENKYETARKKIEGDIKATTINERGDSAVHYSTSGLKSVIDIYNSKGKLEYTVTLTNSNVANMKLSDNSRYLAIYEVSNAGISVSSKIRIVDFYKEDGIKDAITTENDVVYNVFFSGKKLVAVCSEGIYIYNINKGTIEKIDLTDKNISYISADDTGIAYLYKNLDMDNTTLVSKNFIINKDWITEVEDVPKEFLYRDSLSYVTYPKKIRIYNKWGSLVKEYSSNTIITDVMVFNGGKNLAIRYSNRILVFGI